MARCCSTANIFNILISYSRYFFSIIYFIIISSFEYSFSIPFSLEQVRCFKVYTSSIIEALPKAA